MSKRGSQSKIEPSKEQDDTNKPIKEEPPEVEHEQEEQVKTDTPAARLKNALSNIEASIKVIEKKVEESKRTREELSQSLEVKQHILTQHFDKENASIQKALSTDLTEATKRAEKYKKKLVKEIEKKTSEENVTELAINKIQAEINDLLSNQRKLVNQIRDLEIQESKYIEKQESLEKVQEQLTIATQQKQKMLNDLITDVDEMSSAIQKLKEVRGTLNKVIKEQPQQAPVNVIKQRTNQINDPFSPAPQKNQKQPLPQDEDGFWHNIETNKSPLRLPKVSQRPY